MAKAVAQAEGGGPRAVVSHESSAHHGWRAFGPGLLFAVASMGSSHFLLAPTAGAAYGYVLAWTIVVAHVVKYPVFEYATLYTIAAGEPVLEGFRRLPGPRNWAVWAFTIGAAVQSVTIVAGVTAVCAAVLLAAWPAVPLATATVGVSGLAGMLLWFGGYRFLERASVVILALVVVLTAVAVALARPDLSALARGAFVPGLPDAGAALLVGGLLGYMPAPIELAVLESLWYHERHAGEPLRTRPARLRMALLDFRTGYVVSITLGVLLLALGAALLHERGDVPSGTSVFATISSAYRDTLGEGTVPIYLVGAFLGMFATSYGVLDGFPRMVSRGLSVAGRREPRTRRGRDARAWILLYVIVAAGILAILLLPDPARLVSLAATGTVLVAPLWYGLIVAITHRLPEQWRPSRARRATAYAGLAGMFAIGIYVAYGLWA